MERLAQVKDSVLKYFSPPSKRRRTSAGQEASAENEQADALFDICAAQRDNEKNLIATGDVYSAMSAVDQSNALYSRKRAREQEEQTRQMADQADERARKRTREDDEELLEHAADNTNSDQSDDEDTRSYVVEGNEDLEAEWQAEQEMKADLAAKARVVEFLEAQEKLVVAKQAIADVRARGEWREEEIALYEKTQMRGLEAMFPNDWKKDFPTVPDRVFVLPKEESFFDPLQDNSMYHAARYYLSLAKLADRVEARFNAYGLDSRRQRLQGSMENIIRNALQHYINWTARDGRYYKKRFIPVIVVTPAWGIGTDRIIHRIESQLSVLAKQHRDFLLLPEPHHVNEVGEVEMYRRQPPVLYGYLLKEGTCVIVTLNSALPAAKMNHITTLDFKQRKMGMWDAMSLAIVAIMARNYMISIKDELEDDDPPEVDDDDDDLGPPVTKTAAHIEWEQREKAKAIEIDKRREEAALRLSRASQDEEDEDMVDAETDEDEEEGSNTEDSGDEGDEEGSDAGDEDETSDVEVDDTSDPDVEAGSDDEMVSEDDDDYGAGDIGIEKVSDSEEDEISDISEDEDAEDSDVEADVDSDLDAEETSDIQEGQAAEDSDSELSEIASQDGDGEAAADDETTADASDDQEDPSEHEEGGYEPEDAEMDAHEFAQMHDISALAKGLSISGPGRKQR